MNRINAVEPTRIRPKRSLGQNFLVNSKALHKIVSAAEVKSTDTVIEIGPGTGLLTGILGQKAKSVIAVEMDSELVNLLRTKFRDLPSIKIIEGDARKWNLETIGLPYKVVANLPYYAANHILRRFLESSHPPKLLVVTVQKEVAESIVATKGAMRLLSVGVQTYAKPSIVGYLHPESFKPRPKIESAILRLDVLEIPRISLTDRERFFDLVKAGFSSARKQLPNSLSNIYKISTSEIKEILISCGIDTKARAQSLEIEDWKRLYQIFKGTGIC